MLRIQVIRFDICNKGAFFSQRVKGNPIYGIGQGSVLLDNLVVWQNDAQPGNHINVFMGRQDIHQMRRILQALLCNDIRQYLQMIPEGRKLPVHVFA